VVVDFGKAVGTPLSGYLSTATIFLHQTLEQIGMSLNASLRLRSRFIGGRRNEAGREVRQGVDAG
jgi:hypothetical protein